MKLTVKAVLQFFPVAISTICFAKTMLAMYFLSSGEHLVLYEILRRGDDALLFPFPNFLFFLVSDFTKYSDWFIWTSILYLFCILPIALMTGIVLEEFFKGSSRIYSVAIYLLLSLASYAVMIHAALKG